jgi:predicted O-linked N-acetylglucosamine transferase (SPINDLY family)
MSSLNLSHSLPTPSLAQGESRSNQSTNRGFFFHQNLQYADALNLYQEALMLNPHNERAYYFAGQIHHTLHDYQDAQEFFEKAIVANPLFLPPYTSLLKISLETCNWDLTTEIAQALPQPLPPLSVSTELYDLLKIHHPQLFNKLSLQKNFDAFVTDQSKVFVEYFTSHPHTKHTTSRLRLGYLSSQCHHSHTGRQLLTLINHHNRDLFEIFTFSTGTETGDSLEQMIKKKSDHFIKKPLSDLSTLTSLIRHHQIDILINLDEQLHLNTLGALALQAAPIQIHYPGLPYASYSSKLTTSISDTELQLDTSTTSLKHCWYLTTPLPFPDSSTLNRPLLHLPPNKFIFSSLVSPKNISREVAQLWINIIKATENSCLLLTHMPQQAREKLTKLFHLHHLDPDQLIFTTPTNFKENTFKELGYVDLYLESPYYNDHHLSAISLYLGTPVLTVYGNSPHTRTTQSILKHHKLDSLIAKDSKEYQNLAIKLATHPNKLAIISTKVHETNFTFLDPNYTLPEYEQLLQHLSSQ